MTIIFDGREFAREKELQLKKEIEKLREKKIVPKLVSILIGDDAGSKLYLSLKKKAADRAGCFLDIKKFKENVDFNELIHQIENFSKDGKVHGVMVQLPFPKHFTWDERGEIINSIEPKKDVDGMRDDSPYLTPVVKAVLAILEESGKTSGKMAVVGASGFVGKKIMKELRTANYELMGYDIDTKNLSGKLLKADIIVSATGVPDLIRGSMIQEGAVVIDVGSPKGDVQFNEVSKKASFITPVPGGVGPVTIVSLLENLIKSASEK
ncbi:hypothetical protein A2361_02565 [Candidatus Woesebacteria bacterium RIFOXYB1_FULL_40_26]|uniref:Bifunctional protein FolD n=3 Tax=Candidatus Woeseibacteriota TaxID=1752722 RepID=A0A1F8DI09_9BACT|nr:MAG: Bifunctional protein FolD [Candidatus Woesebacteria bacterium GW2011_GWB1_40_101]OGM81205.1 MAG: hypothetical protein A2361_02565 [Candidatus Woesebacteria bacterium RIFOXYB1_FULL_40_26]OGM87679.1 MAG: hypothetical protein A2614_00290 [Candidatus Woesebacteria bacterium RIFOXYD1_FULL_40_21]